MATLTDGQKAQLYVAIGSKVDAIVGYSSELAEDSVTPRGSYHIDGESVDRDKWRKTLADIIAKLQKAIREDLLLISRRASVAWLGKNPRDQIDAEDR